MATTRALSANELTLLIRDLSSRGQNRDAIFILLGALTGFRASELLTLTWGQLLTPTGEVTSAVTISRRLLKGGRGGRARAIRSRRVVLGDRAREAVKSYLPTLTTVPHPEAFVFASRKGVNRPITRCHANFVLREAARVAGIDAERIGVHSLRRTFAKGVFQGSKFNLLVAQAALGHTSPITTARYLRASEAEVDHVVANFDPLAPRKIVAGAVRPDLTGLLAGGA